jgi:hypothetical protein
MTHNETLLNALFRLRLAAADTPELNNKLSLLSDATQR